jgi:LCP family protein required for cell wall assembly
MPDEEKPYRVYRSGRGRGKASTLPVPKRKPKADGRPPGTSPAPKQKPRTRRRRRVGQAFAILLGVLLLWVMAWSLASYFSFRDGVKAANKRLPASARNALDKQDSLLLTNGTTTLLLGTDHSAIAARQGIDHSDSIMLMRTDPDHHRIYYLSIPRDLYVEIPGYGSGRINSAYQMGGAALTLRTVRALTGLKINHIAIVDFNQFKDLIDELGGIDVNVKAPIHSNRFDCPYSAKRCATWTGWRFAKGTQHMNGERALVYTRIRENSLNPADNDLTRAERQQQVLQAISSKLASVGTFLRMPFIGGDLLKPVTTDLDTNQFLQLGWVKWRSNNGHAVHCRLGGDGELIGGNAVIMPSEENRSVISMFSGDSSPQPPPQGSGTLGPGCVVGSQSLGSR